MEIPEYCLDHLAHVSCLAKQYGFVRENDLAQVFRDLEFLGPSCHSAVLSWLDQYQYILVPHDQVHTSRLGYFLDEFDTIKLQAQRFLTYLIQPTPFDVYSRTSWKGRGSNQVLFRRLALLNYCQVMLALRCPKTREYVKKILVDGHDNSFSRYFINNVSTSRLLKKDAEKIRVSNFRTVKFLVILLDRLYKRRAHSLLILRQISRMRLNRFAVEDIVGFHLEYGSHKSERERQLLDRLNDKYIEVRNLLILNNFRLARSAIKRPEYVSDSTFGLVRAIEMFDYTSGHKFSTYAHAWIRSTVLRGRENEPSIRIPSHRLPEFGGIAGAKELCCSLDQLDLDLPENPFKDVVFTPGSLSEFTQHLERLSARERLVLSHRYGLDDYEVKTLEEIGNMLGVTRERIRQIESKAINKLRAVFLPQKKRWV